MSAIWKFTMMAHARQGARPIRFEIPMPPGAFVLHVGIQRNNEPAIWALVNPEAHPASYETRVFYGLMTGENLPFDPLAPGAPQHRGTLLLDDGEFVLHLFEEVPT